MLSKEVQALGLSLTGELKLTVEENKSVEKDIVNRY